jgi:fucose permease
VSTGLARKRSLATLAVQFGTFVVILGIPEGLLGVLWPSMRHALHRPLADLGELVLAGTSLYVVGGLVAERVRLALGMRKTLLSATLVGFGSLLGWAAAPRWWVVLVSLGVLGLVKGVLDAALNADAAVDGGIRRLGLLHASWALGGTLGPVIVALLVSGGNWRTGVLVVAGATALLVPPAALPSKSAPADRAVLEPIGAVAPETTAPPDRARAEHQRSRLGLAVTVLAFFAYTAAESGPVSWGASYLVTDRRLTTAGAATAMALFWAALTIGRLGLALPQRWRPVVVLEACSWLFLGGMALFWLLPGAFDTVGLPIAGLGSATIFPLFVALTPARLGTAATGRAVGWAIAGAALGGPAAVGLFGLLADRFGAGVLAPCLFGAVVCMYLAHRLLAAVVRVR